MKAMLPRARAARLATRRLPDEDPEFQIAPMIDILLVLLVFFMAIATGQMPQSSDGLLLPVARLEIACGGNSRNVLLNLPWSADGKTSMDVDGQGAMDRPSLVAYLQERRREADRQPWHVIIRADKRVDYQTIQTTMALVGEAGVSSVVFSVAEQEKP